MFGRPIKDKLPRIPCKNTTQAYVAHDTLQKGKMKAYADKMRHAIPNMLKPGYTVLVKNQNKHRNKFTSRWNPSPGTIKNVKGNSVIVEHNNKSIMCTSSHVKPYKFQQQTTDGKLVKQARFKTMKMMLTLTVKLTTVLIQVPSIKRGKPEYLPSSTIMS